MKFESLVRWAIKPAMWWQFWLPQSGLPGGLIGGAIFYICLYFTLSDRG